MPLLPASVMGFQQAQLTSPRLELLDFQLAHSDPLPALAGLPRNGEG